VGAVRHLGLRILMAIETSKVRYGSGEISWNSYWPNLSVQFDVVVYEYARFL
jgi:hypothetical protein